MEITQRFVVKHPIDVVWNTLADVPLVADCMPGAELTEAVDERRYKGKVTVKLGPIAAAFTGEAVVERDDETYSGTVEGTGVDGRSASRARGRMTYGLSREAGGGETAVSIEAEIVLSGALAQFGRGAIVNDLAARLIGEFARCLEDKLSAATAAEAAAVRAAEVGLLRLVLTALRDRVLRILKRLFGRPPT